MKQSRRGQVDPFIVMDVMEAARRAEAQGRHIIHMEVGQPSTPAPAGARREERRLDRPFRRSRRGRSVLRGLGHAVLVRCGAELKSSCRFGEVRRRPSAVPEKVRDDC